MWRWGDNYTIPSSTTKHVGKNGIIRNACLIKNVCWPLQLHHEDRPFGQDGSYKSPASLVTFKDFQLVWQTIVFRNNTHILINARHKLANCVGHVWEVSRRLLWTFVTGVWDMLGLFAGVCRKEFGRFSTYSLRICWRTRTFLQGVENVLKTYRLLSFPIKPKWTNQ